MGLILGMDTGGTFTDAVLLDQDTREVVKKAKAPTTKYDLCVGIRECIGNLSYERMEDIKLVCLSTTLATNSIVEGKGCRVGLVITGKLPFGAGTLPEAEIVMAGGALDIRGRLQRDLDEDEARKNIAALKGKVDAVAISGYACVRNPEHEIAVRRIVREELDVPVVCAHELTCELGYYERTVTVVLNARLIPLIKTLMDDTQICLAERGVRAPMMMVKGDGSYMDSGYAEERPVETILSGPAASIKGAMFLSGLDDGTIIDVGGTTSDIAALRSGKVEISMEGAQVGGWKTRVKAIDVYTCGVGGDSRITLKEDGSVKVGPDKVIPVSYASSRGISASIDRGNMTALEQKYRKMFGLSDISNDIGFTPTDMAHLIGIYDAWDREAAGAALKKMAESAGKSEEEMLSCLVEAFRKAVNGALADSDKLEEGVPVVALGAPAEAWMPIVMKDSPNPLVVPKHSEVANAVGAAIGEIEEVVEVLIRFDDMSKRYVSYSKWKRGEFEDLEEAKRVCLAEAEDYARKEAEKCGCDDPEIFSEINDEYCDSYDGKNSIFVETAINVIAVGPPRFI